MEYSIKNGYKDFQKLKDFSFDKFTSYEAQKNNNCCSITKMFVTYRRAFERISKNLEIIIDQYNKSGEEEKYQKQKKEKREEEKRKQEEEKERKKRDEEIIKSKEEYYEKLTED